MTVFEYGEYKNYIRSVIRSNKSRMGYQGRLAAAAKMQRSFLSQVINRSIHITPDHALGMCRFWNFDDDSTQYFMALVHRERAGSPELARFYRDQIHSLLQRRKNLKNRLGGKALSQSRLKEMYYSSWVYAAVHISTTVPDLRSVAGISKALKLPKEQVTEVLKTLELLGVVTRQGTSWSSVDRDLHLEKRSPLNRMNHINWRLKATDESMLGQENSVNFCSVFSLSKKNLKLLRKQILGLLEDSRQTILESEEETVACLNIDLVSLTD